jgi:citrate synthase
MAMSVMTKNWMPRGEALTQLGVKPQTLYAYVSRGRITARPDPQDPRRSLYAADDIARLLDRSIKASKAAGGAPASTPVRGDLSLESALTTYDNGRLYYAGRDVVAFSETATLEQTARLLWGGEDDPFADLKPRVDVNFPGAVRARLFADLARRAEEDAAGPGRGEKSLRREAASILSEAVDSLTGGGPRLYLHQRLGRLWKLDERGCDLLRRALVLSADAEMNAPTLTARIVASTGAPLAASALSGLAALSGPLYSGRLAQVQAYVAESKRSSDARMAARQRLAQGLDLPGFGHPLFPDGDPRAAALIGAAKVRDDMADILRVGEGLSGHAPNFDMALSMVSRVLDLPKDGAFVVLAVGRLVGLLAHALEQAATGSPIQARLRYVGPEPQVV